MLAKINGPGILVLADSIALISRIFRDAG